jgi:hypothetical protein
MDNLCTVCGVPNMFRMENGSQKLANAVVFRPMCTSTSLMAFLICQIQSLETSGNWKILLKFVLQERITFQNRFFDFNHYSRNM